MKRHNGRIIAVQILYNMDLNNLDLNEGMIAFDNLCKMEDEEEYPVEIDKSYARLLIVGVNENYKIINDIICQNLKNYTLDRLSYVDRAIIRVAIYEIIYQKVAKEVAINEALEITREYSDIDNDKQVKFNNKLLDNIVKCVYE